MKRINYLGRDLNKISKSTLVKYNSSDLALYAESFQNIYKLAEFFDVPISIFVDKNS